MKKKRFVKLLMSIGYSRNRANLIADLISVATVELFGKTQQLTYARAWHGARAYARLKALRQKEVNATEA